MLSRKHAGAEVNDALQRTHFCLLLKGKDPRPTWLRELRSARFDLGGPRGFAAKQTVDYRLQLGKRFPMVGFWQTIVPDVVALEPVSPADAIQVELK